MEIFLLCLGFVVAPFVAWGIVELIISYVAPAKKAEATLKKKDTVTIEKANGEKKKKFVLVFDVDGVKKTFSVTQEQFAFSRVNVKGVLVYRGRRFVEFK